MRLDRHSAHREGDGASEEPPYLGTQGAGQCSMSTRHLSLAAKSLDTVPCSRPHLGAANREAALASKTWLPLGSSRHRVPEEKPPTASKHWLLP